MTRYYFDLHNGSGLTRDDEGMDLYETDVERYVTKSIRSLLSDEVARGKMDLAGRIVVRDSAGAVVLDTPFGDAVTITGAGRSG